MFTSRKTYKLSDTNPCKAIGTHVAICLNGNYEQSYTLPDDGDRDKISAGVANGILTITIPKTTPEQEAKVMRNIEVK